MRTDNPRRPPQETIDAAVDAMPTPFRNGDLRKVLGISAFDASEELTRQRSAGRIARHDGGRHLWRRASAAAADHDHEGDRHPPCPSDQELAKMRARDREADHVEREDMAMAVSSDPTAYVIAIEAHDDSGQDIVMHVATTIERARQWCMTFGERQYGGGARYHLIPHRLDAGRDDTRTGTVSVAVYGIRKGGSGIEDLVGTDDETVPRKA